MTTEPTTSPGDNISNRGIQRWYDDYHHYEYYGMREATDGPYVTFADAEAWAKTEYERGVKAGRALWIDDVGGRGR